MSATPFVIERTYGARIGQVWKAITDRDAMKQWYFDIAEFRAEPGYEFQFTGCGHDGQPYVHHCRVTEVVPQERLSYTWRYEDYPGESVVTFELFDEGERTRLRLTHAGLETFPSDNPDFAPQSFAEGWLAIIGTSLQQFVETDMIRITLDIAALPEAVWSVLTDPALISSWAEGFGPDIELETGWTEGSLVVWKGQGQVGAVGIIEAIEAPGYLSMAYYDSIDSRPPEPLGDYRERYRLSPAADGRTALDITSGPLSKMHIPQHREMWEKAASLIRSLAEHTDI